MLPVVAIIVQLTPQRALRFLQADGFADDSVRMIKQIKTANPACQILLFSATFNDRVKRFALKVVPNANEVFVPKEDLSLDVIKQYKVVRSHLIT